MSTVLVHMCGSNAGLQLQHSNAVFLVVEKLQVPDHASIGSVDGTERSYFNRNHRVAESNNVSSGEALDFLLLCQQLNSQTHTHTLRRLSFALLV